MEVPGGKFQVTSTIDIGFGFGQSCWSVVPSSRKLTSSEQINGDKHNYDINAA